MTYAFIVLNDTIRKSKIIRCQQSVNSPSICQFQLTDRLADSSGLTTRAGVIIYAEGTYPGASPVVLFAGRLLPTSYSLNGDGEDSLTFTAADDIEWMSNNPCAMVNEWYNRTGNDASAFPYPTDYTIEQIINTEFASLVGTFMDKPFYAIDWSDVSADIRSIVVPDVQLKGKTWRGVIETLLTQVPNIAYYIDPSTILLGTTKRGPTLRFIDLGKLGTIATATIPTKDSNPTPSANVLALEITEDYTQSYDRVILHGWGAMKEYYEKATKGWDTAKQGLFSVYGGGSDNPILRFQFDTQKWQQFTPDSGGGTWSNVPPSPTNLYPWVIDTAQKDQIYAYWRYKVTHEIIDFRMVKDDSPTPNYIVVSPSMKVFSLAYLWNMGPLGYVNEDGYYILGVFQDGVKIVPFSNGYVNDFGDVYPNPAYYPDYPTLPDAPHKIEFGIGSFEKQYFLLDQQAILENSYIFTANAMSTSDSQYGYFDNMYGEAISQFWPVGEDIWIAYTGRDELAINKYDAALGYGRTLELWDQRFLKYTDINNVVLRDDTAMLQKYADAIFSLASRLRVYGSISVGCDPATINTRYPMGCSIQLQNWDSGTKTIQSRVQTRSFAETNDSWVTELGFDNDYSFRFLELSAQFKSYFESNQQYGTSIGGGGGRNGSGGYGDARGWNGDTNGGGSRGGSSGTRRKPYQNYGNWYIPGDPRASSDSGTP